MDLSTMIVDMLRGDEAEKLGLSSTQKTRDARRTTATDKAIVDGAQSLTNPEYIAYKREAISSGEQVMSPDEFKTYRAGN